MEINESQENKHAVLKLKYLIKKYQKCFLYKSVRKCSLHKKEICSIYIDPVGPHAHTCGQS